MLKLVWVLCVLSGIAVADELVTAPTDSPAVPFNLWVLLQQILTNGGLALLAFLFAKIPGNVGVWIRKILDVLSANIAHKK